ncbi:MAG: methionyl-tRNA formyltransferase [Nitrospirota bacterium]
MGTPAFAVPAFHAIADSENIIAVVTQPDRPSGRGMTLTPSPIKAAALQKTLPIYQPERIRKEPAFIQAMADLSPDMIVVVAFGQILPDVLLQIPKLCCINIHASLLPKFRGAAPIQWSLIRGEKTTGVTSMQMDVGMDTGPTFLQQTLAIDDSETAITLSNRLSQIGADLLVKTIRQIKEESIHSIAQPDEGISDAPLLKKEDGFMRWHESAQAIFNRWRGVLAWPGTTTFYNKEAWKIITLEIGGGASVANREGSWGEPGQIVRLSDAGLDVAAGVGYIRIVQLRLPGGKVISPIEYAAGHSLLMGSLFDKE